LSTGVHLQEQSMSRSKLIHLRGTPLTKDISLGNISRLGKMTSWAYSWFFKPG